MQTPRQIDPEVGRAVRDYHIQRIMELRQRTQLVQERRERLRLLREQCDHAQDWAIYVLANEV